jgi:DNA-3-methyladenine glycosylase II
VTSAKVRTIESTADLEAGLAQLIGKDRRLKDVAKVAGVLPLRRRAAGFGGLARVITGQQLSVASADAIWSRFELAFPEMTADAVLKARVPRFRKAGMSAAKIKTLRAIAAAVRDGLDLDTLAHMPAEQAHARLTEIHGVGPWTADIYLLFCLGHADIFPAGDLALRVAVADAFGMDAPVAPAPLAEMAKAWSPWRSVAATLFWAFYAARRKKKAVPV